VFANCFLQRKSKLSCIFDKSYFYWSNDLQKLASYLLKIGLLNSLMILFQRDGLQALEKDISVL
jgi:hypothetical protein